ncbi:MAG: 50S ribosomal protein L23 [Bacteroidales bacterium]|nr:50S ribosomal protein L23 [Bacteroidales bacterium]HOK97569.1 50S ribosomal protein L23 [Bacteroidales bacterium]HPO64389.1 50S ribosomal protein L23 [Bacteroidales bacterium]
MEIIIKPIVTEKHTNQGEKLNTYGFIVHKKANKIQIKEAIKELYGVTVTSVNTAIIGGKRKTRYTKRGFVEGRTNTYKKAYVTVAEGEKIDFYSNI